MKHYTIEKILEVAGEELVNEARECFTNEKAVETWFNDKLEPLGNLTPYEVCLKDKKRVLNLIASIKYGFPS